MAGPGRARRNVVPAIVVGAVGLLAIGIGQSIPNRHAIEDDLSTRSSSALQDAGMAADVAFTGRDGRVRVMSAADADRAGDLVRAVEGVRVATVVVPSSPSPSPVTTPTVSAAPTVSATSAAPSASPAAEPTTAPQVQQKLVELPPITFENDSATLTGGGRAAVEQAAKLLNASPDVKVKIEGHTDSRGTAEKNLRLSKDRASTVRTTLQSFGVAADRLSSDGFGESRPKMADNSPANQAVNRRVEFIVQK